MTTNSSFGDPRLVRGVPRLAAAAVAVLLLAMAPAANAQQSFKSAEEAADALVAAARSADRKAMLTVLGRDGADIVSSGDAVADAATRQQFLAAYDAKRQVAMEGDGKAILVVGQDDFPFPIPLVRRDGAWQFDTVAGREEILFRRIGRNELRTIQTCLAYVDAQNEYAEKGVAGNGVYAQRIVSRPGQKDGLYWPAQSGDDESPVGDLAAGAAAEGYRAGLKRQPYHGYYYKILTRQGSRAPGGAVNYLARGKMIGGFALLAYPAEYGNSGVMTFLVNHQGIVYQKDLGPKTDRAVAHMQSFNPGGGWERVSDVEQARDGAR
ncbi:MAG TPA: DUF2950 domain-containing protein [Xanthobacteraceae bacterium]|nr:DUF2950 domain-containing protein [Xanthobacteraceae bacterium]